MIIRIPWKRVTPLLNTNIVHGINRGKTDYQNQINTLQHTVDY